MCDGVAPREAIDVFREAAPLILRRLSDARLAVVGNGALREGVAEQVAELGDRVRMFDFSPPAAQSLAATKIFVLPSLWESLPARARMALPSR